MVGGANENGWAVRIAMGRAAAAAALRLRGDVEGCIVEGSIWLRGAGADEGLERMLRQIAPDERYTVGRGGVLTPMGKRIPAGRLPEGTWKPIGELIVPEPQTAAMPGEIGGESSRARVRIVRGGVEGEANVLVTAFDLWAQYALGAAAIRLSRLMFAADGKRAVLWGSPLPPIEGDRCVETSGVAVPCGYTWEPRVDAAVLAKVLGVEAGGLALFSADGTYEHVPTSAFVRAGRSAVRLTMKGGLE